MIIFDGITFAAQREQVLKSQVDELRQRGQHLRIAAVLFKEDAGSVLYTTKKREAAQRVGIGYDIHSFSMADSLDLVRKKVDQLNKDSRITGIIIQKPTKSSWQRFGRVSERMREQMSEAGAVSADYAKWWRALADMIDPGKDVDGLHPSTLEAIKQGTWQQQKKVLPATCKAVLEILKVAMGSNSMNPVPKIIILGKSDILGQPLYYQLKNELEANSGDSEVGRDEQIEIIGQRELQARVDSGQYLLDADIIVSSTGRRHLITGDMVKAGAVIIDVGEPQPDVESETVKTKASFLTPVPGGVGPVTVVSLLENCVTIHAWY